MFYAVPSIDLKLHRGQLEVFKNSCRFRVLVAGRRFGKCLAEDTPVWMADGSQKSIQSVVVGDMVLSMNPNSMAMEPRAVIATECNGVRETLNLRTASRSITSTPHHPHFVNGEFMKVEDVKVGDLIGISCGQPFGTDTTPEWMIDILAIWLAEGRAASLSNGSREVLQRFNRALGNINCKLKHDANYDWRITKAGERSSHKSPFREIFRDLGIYDLNSKTKFIPDFIFTLEKPLIARFLNLWFATDGCITAKGSLQIGLANEKMVRQISDLLAKFNITGSIYHKIHKKLNKHGQPFESWGWMSSNPRSIINFANEIGALGKEKAVDQAVQIALSSRGNCNEYLPISYDDFVSKVQYKPENKGKFGGYNAMHSRDMPSELRLELNSWRKQTTSRMSVKRYLAMRKWVDGYWDNFLSGNVRWEPVLEISSGEPTTTYDIQVEGNHTFVANGIVTHNTVLAKVEIMRAAKGRGKKLIWYVAPTFSMAREIMWDDLIEAIPPSWILKKHETRLEIRLINGTVIQLKGADRPDTLRGRGVNFVILDEFQDFRPNVWSAILFPTLTTTQGRMLCIGTPKSYNHFYELYRMGQIEKNRRNASWWSWQFPTIMSPFFPPSEIKLARANLDPKTFRQEFEASFESMAGRVYYAFDRQKHIGNYPFNPLLPIIVGQDFNVDPMSSVIMQIQPNGQIWIVDEIFMPNSNTLEVCEELDRKYFRYKANVTIYPDPAGANRASSRGETDLDIFRERGYRKLIYKKKHPLVSDRVATVNSMFEAANGDMNLFVNTRCLKTIESLEQTIYKAGTPTVDKSQGNEHMADAVGYPIHYLFGSRFKKMVGFSF